MACRGGALSQFGGPRRGGEKGSREAFPEHVLGKDGGVTQRMCAASGDAQGEKKARKCRRAGGLPERVPRREFHWDALPEELKKNPPGWTYWGISKDPPLKSERSVRGNYSSLKTSHHVSNRPHLLR